MEKLEDEEGTPLKVSLLVWIPYGIKISGIYYGSLFFVLLTMINCNITTRLLVITIVD